MVTATQKAFRLHFRLKRHDPPPTRNTDPLPTRNTMLRVGGGSCLLRLKCKRNAFCVAVTNSLLLKNVSTINARCSPVQFIKMF